MIHFGVQDVHKQPVAIPLILCDSLEGKEGARRGISGIFDQAWIILLSRDIWGLEALQVRYQSVTGVSWVRPG